MKTIALLSLSACAAVAGAETPSAPDSGTLEIAKIPARTVLLGRLPEGVSYFDAGYSDYKPLLDYIDDHDIDPVAPVEGDPGAAPGTLAFPLGEQDTTRRWETTARVSLRTLPETWVARHAFRGGYDKDTLAEGEKKLREWLAREKPEWRVTGRATYAYWSPYYYPAPFKKAEVRIPVERIPAEKAPAPRS